MQLPTFVKFCQEPRTPRKLLKSDSSVGSFDGAGSNDTVQKNIKSHKNHIKPKQNQRIIKRGKQKQKTTNLTMFSNNLASLRAKLKSFKMEIKRVDAAIFTLQETHSTSKGKFHFDDFETFETIRKNKEKGGTMIGVHKSLKPKLINEYDETFELLVIEINVANKDIRVISGYGPQEKAAEVIPFYLALEEEIIKAELAGKSVIIEADFNSKLGPEFIPNDPKPISDNGKILAEIIKRQKLTVANGLMKCQGTITRERILTNRTERSAISFVLLSEDLVNKVEYVLIDEKHEHAPTRMNKTKDGVEKKASDHNVIITKFKIPGNRQKTIEKTNMFNLNNKKCQAKFKTATSNTNILSKIFNEENDLEKAVVKFMKRLEKLLFKCFNKIGHKKEKLNEAHEKLYNRWRLIKDKNDVESKAETDEIEAELATEYFDKVQEAARNLDCDEGGMSSGKLWALRKQLCPRTREPPTAMVDSEGNLVTDERENQRNDTSNIYQTTRKQTHEG